MATVVELCSENNLLWNERFALSGYILSVWALIKLNILNCNTLVKAGVALTVSPHPSRFGTILLVQMRKSSSQSAQVAFYLTEFVNFIHDDKMAIWLPN